MSQITSFAVPNQPPTAQDQQVNVDANTASEITLSASDQESDQLTASVVDQPFNGILSDIDQQTGKLTYTPNQDFSGTDSFTFKVNDGISDSTNRGMVSIIVAGESKSSTGPNQPPTAQDQQVNVDANTASEITLSASDQESDQLTASVVDQPFNGILSDIDQQTGKLTYTPNQDFSGTDSFTFKVNDGVSDSSNKGVVSITVSQDGTGNFEITKNESNPAEIQIPNARFISYDKPDVGVKMVYPDNWDKSETNVNTSARYNKIVEFISADQSASLWVMLDNAETTNVDLMKSLRKNIKVDKLNLAEESFVDLKILSEKETSLSGFPAYSLEYSFTDSGTEIKEYQIATSFQGKGFIVTYSSVPEAYQTYFPLAKKMIDSIDLYNQNRAQTKSDAIIDIYYDYEWLMDPLNVYIVSDKNSPSLNYMDDAASAIKKWSSLLKQYSHNYDAWNFEIYTSTERLDFDNNGEVVTQFDPPAHIILELRSGGEGAGKECLKDAGRSDPFPQDPYKAVYALVFTSCADEIPSFHDDVYTTVLHEFAHELGLGHTFYKDGDLMCSEEEGRPTCAVYYGLLEPSALDVNAILYRYGTDGFFAPNHKFKNTDDYTYKYRLPT